MNDLRGAPVYAGDLLVGADRHEDALGSDGIDRHVIDDLGGRRAHGKALLDRQGKRNAGAVSMSRSTFAAMITHLTRSTPKSAGLHPIVRFSPHYYNTQAEIDRTVADKSTRIRKTTSAQRHANQALSAARAPVEHGFSDLKNWRILTRLRRRPANATMLLRALLVLTRQHTSR
jgi:DDE superfamily endonuclease